MDDITVYGGSFEECLINLEIVLHRCIDKILVLNWEKCHFMVNQPRNCARTYHIQQGNCG